MVATCLTQASNEFSTTFFLMTISLFFLLPLLILIILYAIIAKNLISSDKKLQIRLSKPEISFKARKQVVLMLGAVVLSFFMCLLPFRVLTLWIVIASEETFHQLGVETYYNLLYFCRIMWYLNSCLNPLLYNLMSSKFRKGFLRLCSCCLFIDRKKHLGEIRSRTATFNTTTTTLTHSSVYHHQQILNEQRKLSGKLSLSLDDLRLLDLITHPEKKRRLTRQYSTPLVCRLPAKTETTITSAATLTYRNETELECRAKPKKTLSIKRIKFKHHDDSDHDQNYHKQLSLDENLLINNNHRLQPRYPKRCKTERKHLVRFSTAITTSPSHRHTHDEKRLRGNGKISFDSKKYEPNSLVPLLFPHDNGK